MLTGKTRYRVGWRKKLVLQVQYSYGTRANFSGELLGPHYQWRDATNSDLFELDKLERHHERGVPYIPQAGYDAATRGSSEYVSPRPMPGHNPPPTYAKPPPPPSPPACTQSRWVRDSF